MNRRGPELSLRLRRPSAARGQATVGLSGSSTDATTPPPSVDEVIRRSLTGHVTKQMTEHYSTVGLDEKRAAMEAAGKQLRASSDRAEKEKAA